MAATFFLFLSHVMVMLGAEAQPTSFLANMADNPLVNGASDNLYSAVIANFGIGIVWAVVYAKLWEPRVKGGDLFKGLSFSLIPWFASVTLFFPLAGIGLFGSKISAGPVPALGSLILHLIYGAMLAVAYGPIGERMSYGDEHFSPERKRRIANRASRGGALGLLLGTTVGACFAVTVALFPGLHNMTVANLPGTWFVLASTLFCCSMGMLVGLWTGAKRHVLDI